jgi:hypothetical protein
MKKYYRSLLIMLLLISTGLCGQSTYSPVNFDYGRWVFTSYQKGPFWGSNYETDTLRYYFDGDTVINSYTYRKLFFTGISYSQTIQGLEYKFVSGYSGAMRDDTANRQVWFDGSIAYDYNLSVNDTVKTGIYQGMIIGSIDSVLYCGQYFTRFNFQNTSNEPALIENIRALDVVIVPYNGPTGWCNLECYYETNSTICSSCITVLGLQNTNPQKLTIYPNPTEGKVMISGISGTAEISLFDMYGKRLFCRNSDQAVSELDIAGYRDGAYMVRILTKSGLTTITIIKL